MSLYDPERDPVRIAGRWLRWGGAWVLLPLLLGIFVSANVDVRSLPLFGPHRARLHSTQRRQTTM